MATVTLKGNACQTNGNLPQPGTSAPDFTLTTSSLADVNLATYSGKKKLLSIVPSLDTPTCALSTQKFNEYAKSHTDTVILIVSADLPFAQARFCTGESLDNVVPLSMLRTRDFARAYGVMLESGPLAGLTARAVVVLDEDNQVKHAELVSEIADEPDYQQALGALG